MASAPSSSRARLSPRARHTLINLLRITVSLGLLAILIAGAGSQSLLDLLRRVDLGWYALAFGISTLTMILRAARWKIILDAVGARLAFRRALYLNYIGAFFNIFLPTGLGGDVVRVLEFGPGATPQQATGAILVDRIAGFLVMFVLALITLPVIAPLLPPLATLLVALMALGAIGAAALLFEGRLLRRWLSRLPRALSLAGDTWLGETYAVITACGKKAVARALGQSVLYTLVLVGAQIAAAHALGLNVPAWAVAVFLPVITATLLVPLSINGIGIREATMVALYAQVGLSQPQALGLSLAWFALEVLDGLAGGLMYGLAGMLGLRSK
jgi:hypothetical protein